MRSSLPFFSVVMPAYNADEFIAEAIESVLAQTYKSWELIIVDDLSTDSTKEIISQFSSQDSRIKFFQMDKNSGSAYQPRKKAIEVSSGKYIVALDADDSIESDYLLKMFNRINQTGSETIYGEMYNERMCLPIETFDRMVTLKGKDAVKYTLNGWEIGANGAAIKRKVYDETLKKYSSDGIEMNADEILTRQILIESKSISFSSARYYYRINPESITKSFGIHRFSILETNQQLKNLVLANFLKGSNERRLIEIQCLNTLLWCIKLYNQHKKELKLFSKDLTHRFKVVYNQIDWSIINDKLPLKIFIFKQNLTFIKLYVRLASIYNGIFKRRE